MAGLYPHATVAYRLSRCLPMYQTALEYCIDKALDNSDIDWDQQTDQLVFHYRLTDMDRELLNTLMSDAEEIWMIMKPDKPTGGVI